MTVIHLQSLKVTQLKEMCRERSLPVSGRKADLIERLETAILSAAQSQQTAEAIDSPSPASRLVTHHDETTSEYLIVLVKDYVKARGGVATSRDIGRFLAATQAPNDPSLSALSDLKKQFGSLAGFIRKHASIFVRDDRTSGSSSHEFHVSVV